MKEFGAQQLAKGTYFQAARRRSNVSALEASYVPERVVRELKKWANGAIVRVCCTRSWQATSDSLSIAPDVSER